MIFAFAKIGVSVQYAVFRGMSLKSQVSSLKNEVLCGNANRNFSLIRGVAGQHQPKSFIIHHSPFIFSSEVLQ